MNYTKNHRPTSFRMTRKEERKAKMDGFKASVLACAWIWNNKFETDAEDLRDLTIEALNFMVDISKSRKDPDKVNEVLKEMTGVDIMDYLD